jgi:signal transduction histidine kinase
MSQQVYFTSDPILLKRVLTNMVKNAIEASAEGHSVTIGSQLIDSKVNFWVKNENVIPDNVQLQIFQRSFSTKGISRGLGTYSMKLIGEKYLKGKVSFQSNEKTKTIFTIDLPTKFE